MFRVTDDPDEAVTVMVEAERHRARTDGSRGAEA
jgi:hypothetical protein